jgi:L-ascorbate metabolism protein UlaG (beta-lactamase superfamily)
VTRTSGCIHCNRVIWLSDHLVIAPGAPTIYHGGDTGLFGDMKILGEIYRPDIAFLPIGDRFTMGPDTAAIAARWLGVRQVAPMHWGTSPILTGTPAALSACLEGTDIDVLALEPGETASRTDWSGPNSARQVRAGAWPGSSSWRAG